MEAWAGGAKWKGKEKGMEKLKDKDIQKRSI